MRGLRLTCEDMCFIAKSASDAAYRIENSICLTVCDVKCTTHNSDTLVATNLMDNPSLLFEFAKIEVVLTDGVRRRCFFKNRCKLIHSVTKI